MADEIYCEQHLLTIKECFVYKVPPLRTASGHRAEDWHLDTPMMTGCLKIMQTDLKLRIVVYSYKNPTCTITTDDNLNLFAECPIEVKPKEDILGFVDGVIDSSRYFVLRIKDPKSTKTILLGIGFRDRDVAFDFKNVLNEYVRYVGRQAQASDNATEHNELRDSNTGIISDAQESSLPVSQMKDMSIRPGEKIKISTKFCRSKNHATDGGGDDADTADSHSSSNSHTMSIGERVGGDSIRKLAAPPAAVLATAGGFKCFALAPPPVHHATMPSSSNSSDPPISIFTTSATATLASTSDNANADEDWGDFSS